MSEYYIRLYKSSDKDQILHLLRLNTPAFFAPSEEADLLYYLNDESEHYYVVESGKEILGCGGFNLWENGTEGRISWDMVHPDHRGKGIGGQLLAFRIEKLHKIPGVERIVVRTSQLAHEFYARFGFELKEVVKDYWEEGFDLYYMEMPA